jgi:hypothetical protein
MAERLPTEILDMIFAFADSDDEHALARVCRTWHAVMVNRFCVKNKLAHSRDMVETRNGGKAPRARMWRTRVSAYCNSVQRLKYAITNLGLPTRKKSEKEAIRLGGAFRGCADVYLSPEFRANAFHERRGVAYNLVAGGHAKQLLAWMADYPGCTSPYQLTAAAVSFDRLDMLTLLKENELMDTGCAFFRAGKAGNLKIFNHLAHTLKLTCCGQAMEEAARRGHLALVKMCHEMNVQFDPYSLRLAAYSSNHLELVQYVLDIAEPYEKTFTDCYDAAVRGTGPIMKLLRDRGYPWREDTTRTAVYRGNLSTLRYAVEEGCPCDPDLGRVALLLLKFECAEYLYSKGFDVQTDPKQLTGPESYKRRIVAFLRKHPAGAQKDVAQSGESEFIS